VKNHFLDKINKILKREDLMRQFHEQVKAQQSRPRSIDLIQSVWLAILGIATIAMNWDIGEKSAHTFHDKSKMVTKDL